MGLNAKASEIYKGILSLKEDELKDGEREIRKMAVFNMS